MKLISKIKEYKKIRNLNDILDDIIQINDKIIVFKKDNIIQEKLSDLSNNNDVIAYVIRKDKKFFDGIGKYIYDFSNSDIKINPLLTNQLESWIKNKFYNQKKHDLPKVSANLIEFDYYWEDNKKIHKKLLSELNSGDYLMNIINNYGFEKNNIKNTYQLSKKDIFYEIDPKSIIYE